MAGMPRTKAMAKNKGLTIGYLFPFCLLKRPLSSNDSCLMILAALDPILRTMCRVSKRENGCALPFPRKSQKRLVVRWMGLPLALQVCVHFQGLWTEVVLFVFHCLLDRLRL